MGGSGGGALRRPFSFLQSAKESSTVCWGLSPLGTSRLASESRLFRRLVAGDKAGPLLGIRNREHNVRQQPPRSTAPVTGRRIQSAKRLIYPVGDVAFFLASANPFAHPAGAARS
jgi:hypothetical protein